MNFFTWLTTKRKNLATMSVTELRAQEMMLENERDRLEGKLRKLANEKQKIIEKGAQEKTPELRRTMAQQFDLLHTEQLMTARHLNIRAKECITVSRLRMAREMSQRAGLSSGAIATIRESDLATIEQLIENDQISTEMYQERLDRILELGVEADQQATGMSPAAAELLRVWDDMDAGLIRGSDAAFDETERRVRERGKAAE